MYTELMPRSSTIKKGVTKRDTAIKKAVIRNQLSSAKTTNKSKSSSKSITKTIQQVSRKIKPTDNIKRNPLGHLLMEKMFREAGFRGGISCSKELLDTYSTDESIFSIRPQVVLQPKARRDVEIATKIIAEQTKRFESLSLTPRAAGTGLSGGSLTDSIVIDMCAHINRVGDVLVKKNKITFTCEAGAMWKDVEKKLKKYGAYLPPYPASKDFCSVGGSIANNAAGPDSLRYGQCADWIESLDVVLHDGHSYTVKPLNYREFKMLIKQDHEYARIAQQIFDLIVKNEKLILNSKPDTKKNTSGYPLWSVMPDGVAKFKKGVGTFDLTKLIAGSQGTIGIITNLTLRALEIQKNTTLIMIPVFNLEDTAHAVERAMKYNPINIEIFDALTFDLALQNPNFFKKCFSGIRYYRAMLSMYTTYHVRFARKTPEFILLITLDETATAKTTPQKISQDISVNKLRARYVQNEVEADMFWQIRRSSYSLSKLLDKSKRPAAFLEDMTVPPKNLSKFLVQVKQLLKEFNITTTIHGHGGDGHFHFYPLLDFTNKTTPALVEKMSEKFFAIAAQLNGSICGEHNDGIVRTPHLNKMYSKGIISLFEKTEKIFDPDDIFNPGKKVNPRFNIKKTMRNTN